MQDAEAYKMFLALAEQIKELQLAANESVILVHAMKESLSRHYPATDSDFEEIHREIAFGPLGHVLAEKVQECDALIAALRRLIQ